MGILTKEIVSYLPEEDITALEAVGHTAEEADNAVLIERVPTAVGRLLSRFTTEDE